jgi:hypothetical protein
MEAGERAGHTVVPLATRHLLTLLQPSDGEYLVQRTRAGESGGEERGQSKSDFLG